MGGTTGWHWAITRNARYAPYLPTHADHQRVWHEG
jgi:hypothetical protein